ncbi:MAG: ankyrin repeat domain-containing protein [Planctomycetota bacterium]
MAGEAYVDPNGFFSIRAPAGWRVKNYPDDPRGKAAFLGPNGVDLRVLAKGVEYDDFETMFASLEEKREMLKRSGIRMELERIEFGGRPAVRRRLEFRGTKMLAINIIVDRITHDLQYSAPAGEYDTHLSVAMSSMKTYRPSSPELTAHERRLHALAGPTRVAEILKDRGTTPLHVAAITGNTTAVEELLKNGANVNAPDHLGNLPLKTAVHLGQDRVADLLRSHGAQLAKDIELQIGEQHCTLSANAQEYLTLTYQSDSPSPVSVVIVSEPHYYSRGQFNLYKGLDVFLAENRHLLSSLAFLAEGIEAHFELTVRPLISEEANPNDALIRKVLDSFLIPGYVAWEWKNQVGVPIVGTEDPYLYRASVEFYTNKNSLPFALSILARNERIAETVIEKTFEHHVLLLFVGGAHIRPIDDTVFSEAMSGDLGVGHALLDASLRSCDNIGIGERLQKAGIGYLVIEPVSYERDELRAKHEDRYRQVFAAQQAGMYDAYVQEACRVVGEVGER